MCFSGGSKVDNTVQQVPVPAPAPVATPTDVNPIQTADQRRNKIAALKFGSLSTLKTAGGAQGLTGTGPDLYNPTASGKKTLGA